MKRVLLTLLLAAALLLPVGLFAAAPRVDVVAPLGYITPENTHQNICTAGSINRQRHLFATSGHCVSDDNETISKDTLLIADEPATVVLLNLTNDIAVLRAPTVSRPAMKLASADPTWEDELYIVSYPYGQGPLTFRGHISALGFSVAPFLLKGYIFQLPVCPASSGSPITNADGRMVSIAKFELGDGGCSPVSGGPSLNVLKEVLKSYVG